MVAERGSSLSAEGLVDVDHVEPLEVGGVDTIDNLVPRPAGPATGNEAGNRPLALPLRDADVGPGCSMRGRGLRLQEPKSELGVIRSMESAPSDSSLIAASLTNGEVFAELFDRHFDAISAFMRRRMNQSIADELTAETFLIAYRNRGQFDTARNSAKPWLFGIATNLIRHDRRSEARRLRAFSRLDRGQEPDFTDVAHSRSDAEAMRASLAEAIRSLSNDEANVLLLFAWADLSYDEIAEALEIPIGTVRSRLARARKNIQGLIAANREESEGVSADGK